MNHRKVVTIMKSKSGISLVFVLAVTLLLLAIGASTLVAASTAAGSSQSQVAYRQMELYTDSLVKTLTYQLKLKPSDDFERTLSGKLLLTMYQHEKSGGKDPLTQQLTATLNSESPVNTNITVSDFKLKFEPLDVEITPAVEGEDAVTGTNTDGSSVVILPGTERQPEIARVNATVKVTICLRNGENKMSSVATYEYTDGYLEDGKIESVLGLGNWRLAGYERVDQIS